TRHWRFAGAFVLLGLALSQFAPGLRADETAASEPGIDLAGIDRSLAPGDDFYAYANGAWMKATEIPADRAAWGSFAILAEEANRRTQKLIQEAAAGAEGSAAANSDARKVGDYYLAYLDEATIEKLGKAPLEPELAAIAALRDKAALSRFLGGQLRADVDPLNSTNFHTDRLFGLWVSPDFDNPAKNAAYMLQGGLGMPDRDNYTATDAANTELQAKYRNHIARVLELAGLVPAGKSGDRAARIYALEAKIAKAHATRTESMEVQRAHNRWTLSAFSTKAPGLDWPAFFATAGLSEKGAKVADLMVWHPGAVTGIAALVGSEPLADWQDYLAFRVADRGSPWLSKAFVDESFSFYGTALSGATQLRDRWKRGVDGTNAALGDAVGKLYAAKYFPPESKAAAQEMVRNIVAAFGKRVDKLAWMSPATRAKAKAKLDTLYVGIGYPDTWRNYDGLVVKREDAYGNSERSDRFDYATALSKLAKPADRTEWWMTPQTVNAVNLPLQNALNFPAAILEPPFFDAHTDAAQNYGGIGTVIGHEISHSFDDQGALFDASGKLANWWTDEDMAHFQAAATRLTSQYDAYEPLPGSHVNGKLTLSENIADVAGISAAYDGYRAFHGGKEGPAAQGLTGDQRFFLSFGQIWRAKARPEALRNSLMTNGHAPGEFRADTVRNIDAWYAAFQIPPTSRLALAPEARVRVW
ncbi:MAG: M13 family metallopeptidase, partial [Thermoanaerobaculia bacterium]